MTTIKDYCVAMNVTYMVHQFEDGQTWTFTHAPSGTTWHGSFHWGESPQFFNSVRRWLDALPWPTEDDPRVIAEGAYLER